MYVGNLENGRVTVRFSARIGAKTASDFTTPLGWPCSLKAVVSKHPDKTFIGGMERGFDFPGYHLGPEGVTVAGQTVVNFVTKAARLYEQERMGAGAPDALGMYVRRWVRWARAGLGVNGGKGETATRLVRLYTVLLARRDVRRQPSVSCASRLSPT